MRPLVHTERVGLFLGPSQQRDVAAEAAGGVGASPKAAGLPAHAAEVARGGLALGWEVAAEEPTCR
eukprot:7866602-Lingulodinium_polyedra.AAC.1